MGNTEIMLPVGAIDQRSGRAMESTSDGSPPEVDAVAAALSLPVRGLIAAVLAVNLSLGAWLVGSSDFTNLKPQGSEATAQAQTANSTGEAARGNPAGKTPALEDQDGALKVAAANDRE